ncbi:MAG: TldD/PmbA family protein [Oscillospiraceae bacterium]|nr:TldD/PmbA family protein [Oscillospiraceae bacterium]
MKYNFPEGLYTDVRIEHVFSTTIKYTNQDLQECREQKYSAAFVRVYDGKMWYYASTSDLNGIQGEIDALAALAEKNPKIEETAIYKNLSAHKDIVMAFVGREVSNVPLDDKIALLKSVMPIVEANEYVKLYRTIYLDGYTIKEFYNSKGAELMFDWQRTGFVSMFTMAQGERKMDGNCQKAGISFPELIGFEQDLEKEIAKCQEFMLNSEPVEPGKYSVIFAPLVTGVFVHECFGHKSESDFMIGDETTRKEWELGKRVGADDLTIAETGSIIGNGYTPYDDEGNKATMTHLIKNGVLAGRLHNAESATDLEEPVTGNARAMSFEYEPIVRMTTTYIDKGSKTFDELISETENGILLTSLSHGSGMSTFTIAPTYCYLVKNGKIDKPVRVSVVTGNVFEALGDIDGISDKVEMFSFVTGGCGKMEQSSLPVGFGGPYIRVRNMQVQ